MNERLEEVKKWLVKADHDLGGAKLIYLNLPEYFDIIAFHCQQATEKYLKAILKFYGIEFKRSHDLVYLLELLADNMTIDEDLYKKAVTLNSFSVQIRYPDKIDYLSDEELSTSLNIAQEFREFAVKIIEK